MSARTNTFTILDEGGSKFLMRGQICLGEVKALNGRWIASGHGWGNQLGSFETFTEAMRAAADSACKTLNEAGLAICAPKRPRRTISRTRRRA